MLDDWLADKPVIPGSKGMAVCELAMHGPRPDWRDTIEPPF